MRKRVINIFSKILKIYKERLYYLNIGEDKRVSPRAEIIFKEVTLENYSLIKNLRGERYSKEFEKMLVMKDFGLFAFIGEKPVGYGWAKTKGSTDFFFNIENCYLCRFYVSSNHRGLNIYPALIQELIKRVYDKKNITRFYIAVEDTNKASIRGLEKIGFKFMGLKSYVRFMKVTLNKTSLK